ncbi:MAG: hypothetical protein HUN04_20055 [Desulfobacter sp.]|nr:MAG: hypothetical protein HUN04_20055 [Desulfobacter sp.]
MPSSLMTRIWIPVFVLFIGLIPPATAAEPDLLSRMTARTEEKMQATFMVPDFFKIKEKKGKTEFSSKDGSAVISFQPMATKAYGGKYKDAEEMTQYLSRQMIEKVNAKVEPARKRNIAGRIAWQLFMDWKIEGQPVKQCETILVEKKRLVTFTFIATPASWKKYWPFYKETLHSYRRLEGDTGNAGSKKKDAKFLKLTVDGAPLDVTLEKKNVGVLFKTGEAGKYTVKSTNMREASALLTLYDTEGNKITDNISKDKKLTIGFRIKLAENKVYMVVVSALNEKQHGRVNHLVVTSPIPQPKTPPVPEEEPPVDDRLVPFTDEAALMARIEENPTEDDVNALAATRAAKARDLLVYAEENRDGHAFSLALDYAESAGELNPDCTGIKMLKAGLYARAADLPLADQLAETQLVDILQTEPDNSEALLLLGELYFSRQRFFDAVPVFEDLLRTGFQMNGRVVTMVVNAYALAGETARGRKFIADLSLSRGSTVPLNIAGALLARHGGDNGTAMVYITQVINTPDADEKYRLYAKQLKTIWAKEAE